MLWATESGGDLSKEVKILKTFLKDKKINNRIAYCLSYHFVREKTFEHLDFLLEYLSIEVRKGGLPGLGVRLCSSKQKDYEIIHRLLLGLSDKKQEVHSFVAELLQQGKRKKRNTTPNSVDLKTIVDSLGKTSQNEAIIPFLVGYTQNKPKLAKEVLALIEKPQKLQLRLQQICRSIIEGTYSPICTICENIPQNKSYWHYLDVPKEVQQLVPKILPASLVCQSFELALNVPITTSTNKAMNTKICR